MSGRNTVATVFNMLRLGLRARDIITKKSLENAVVVFYALGGSTNAVLHLLAIAAEADVRAAPHHPSEVPAVSPSALCYTTLDLGNDCFFSQRPPPLFLPVYHGLAALAATASCP
jgi:hypothetical protein